MPVCESSQIELRRKFISDAFHTLNQPLTGLHCGLEIALQKPRSAGEYRQRISDGVDNAGVILRLLRAVRELVESADPGERYGTVSLGLLLSQLKSDLEVVAETTNVQLHVDAEIDARVLADPAKLMGALGTLIAEKIEEYGAGAEVRVGGEERDREVVLTVSGAGERIEKCTTGVVEIRRNAACSYLWTLGGECEETSDAMMIKLPVSKS